MSRTILRIAPLVLTIVAQVLQPVSAPPDAREKAVALVERGLSLGDNSEAEAELYRKAVATDPTYAAAYFNLGFVLQKQARFKEAIDAYRGCIRYDPSRAVAYLNLSTVLEHVHGESAMLEVRSLLNRYVELIEKRERLSQARDRILAIERRLAELSNVEVKEMHEADEIVEQLTRGFRRGDSPYAGPRIPMLIQFEFDSARIRPESEPQLRQVADALPPFPIVRGDGDDRRPYRQRRDGTLQRGAVAAARSSGPRPPREPARSERGSSSDEREGRGQTHPRQRHGKKPCGESTGGVRELGPVAIGRP